MQKRTRKTSQSTVVAEGKFLRFLDHQGYEYVQRNNCSGIVIIVPITQQKKVIFVEQYRLPVDRKVIEFPAGLVNDVRNKPRETLAAAAKRELFEETGYRAAKMTKLLDGPVSGGASADMVTMFRASGLKKIAAGGGDHTEMITVHEVFLNRAESWLAGMARKGFLVEPKIYAGLYFLKKGGR